MLLKISKNEAQKLIECLDLYSRVFMGQYDQILFQIRFSRIRSKAGLTDYYMREEEIEEALHKARNLALPDAKHFGFNGSYGIWSDKNDMRSIIAYDIQQVLRHSLAYHDHPEGGITVNFREPWIHGDTEPIKVSFEGADLNPDVIIEMNERNRAIITDAVKSYLFFYKGKMKQFLEFFTDNDEAIRLVDELELDKYPVPADVKEFERLLSKVEDLKN